MIDAHQHCWKPGAHGCVWPTPDLTAIYREFTLEEAGLLAGKQGVTGAVLVQSQQDDADTDYLLALAAGSDFVQAVVGWVDLLSAHAPRRIEQLAAHAKLRGLRPMLQAKPDDNWILQPGLAPAIEVMLQHRLCFDALVLTRHLPGLNRFVQRYPALPVVIDHGAKPPFAHYGGEEYRRWQKEMQQLAQHPQVYCKLSGLVTEMQSGQGETLLQDCIGQLLGWFGSDRLLWGSDWPVVNLAANGALGSYEYWHQAALRCLAGCSVQQREAITRDNARRFYRITIEVDNNPSSSARQGHPTRSFT